MNLLCGYHAKDPQVCKWVLDNTSEDTTNLTEKSWRDACKEHLNSLSNGPDLVSTGQ